MSPSEINIAIAEVLGVKPVLVDWSARKGDSLCFSAETKREVEEWLRKLPEGSWAKDYEPWPFYICPDYANSLDAMHEAEKTLQYDDLRRYVAELQRFFGPGYFTSAHCATAAQRAEAFLRVKGLWK